MDEKKFVEEVRQIFTSLAMRCPFSYPLLTLQIKIDPELQAIAATDSVKIVINPKRWNILTKEQKLFVALHEWLHIALMHPKRIRTRKYDVYNAAADFVVNWMIHNDFPDFAFPPGNPLYDDRYAYKSVEEVYKDLEVEIKKQQEQDGKGQSEESKGKIKRSNPKPGGTQPLNKEQAAEKLKSSGLGEQDIIEMPEGTNEAELVDMIVKAAARHKTVSRHPLPAGYEEFIARLRKSKVPWTRIFARLAKQTLKRASDRNPFKPDPKYLPFDIFIPTEVGTGVPKVVLIVDTSGSMNSEEFEYALGNIQKVCSMCEKVTLITTDTQVQEVVRIKSLKNQLANKKIQFKGRGGTDMTPAFEAADKMRPDLIILYSDLYLPEYPPRPRAPVIWLSREKPYMKPPYGSYIRVETDDAE